MCSRPQILESYIMASTTELQQFQEVDPVRYRQYVATQRRVTNWVQQTRSHVLSTTRVGHTKRDGSSSGRSSSRHTRKRDGSRGSNRITDPFKSSTTPTITPSIALVSSLLVVYALLPSILTLSAFVFLLTLASVDKQVRKTRFFSELVTHNCCSGRERKMMDV